MKVFLSILLLIAVAASGVLLLSHIEKLDKAVTATTGEVAALNKRLAHVEKELEKLRTTPAPASSAQQPHALGDKRELQITLGEAAIIRSDILDQPGVAPDMNAVATVGEILHDVSLRQLPIELTTKIPKITGFRFVLDSRWAIAIVDPSTNRVVALIPPV